MASSSGPRGDHIIEVKEAGCLGASPVGDAVAKLSEALENEKAAVKQLIDNLVARKLTLREEGGRLVASPVPDAVTKLPVALENEERAEVQRNIDQLIDRKYSRQQGRFQNRGVLGFFREKVQVKVQRLFKEKTKEEKAEEKARKAKEKEPKEKDEIRKGFCEAKLPQCYEEIVKLIEIENSPIHAKALKEWTKKATLFTNRVERKKKKVANLKNEIYQLIGFFSVFQGVLLTAVSQSNLLHCNNWWSPIILSLVASVVTIAGVYQKLMQIRGLQKTIHSEEECLKEVVDRSSNLRSRGVQKFKFAKFREDTEKRKQSKLRHRVYFWLVIGSLLIFAAGFPLSHWRILCDSGPTPYPN